MWVDTAGLCHHRPLTAIVAPHFHPMSSCSQQWLGVLLGWWRLCGPSPVLLSGCPWFLTPILTSLHPSRSSCCTVASNSLWSGSQGLCIWDIEWGGRVVGIALVVANQGTLTPPHEQWLTRLDVSDGSSWCQVAMLMLCVKKPHESCLVAAAVWVLLVHTLWVPPLQAPNTPLHSSYSR